MREAKAGLRTQRTARNSHGALEDMMRGIRNRRPIRTGAPRRNAAASGTPVYHVISHTHWDPEWYLPFQHYRARLVALMDKLLALLRRRAEYGPFMLDGQTHMIESYLDVCPERAGELRRFARAGRLAAGPWYLMPELFMLSGECHVRNLQRGLRMTQNLGGAMRVGYLCDTPGFISQLAQILQGFDIGAAFGWRGVAGYPGTRKTPFWLESPDGSRVLMLAPPAGYGAFGGVADEPARAPERLAAMERAERRFWATDDCVLMDGDDHREPAEGILAALEEIRRGRKDVRVVLSTLPRYVSRVLAQKPRLAVHRGELRCTERSFIFASGILATRMDVKQGIFRSQARLEKWAEPLCAIRWAQDGAWPAGLLREAWRLQLVNAFHDVVYGGHVDAVRADALNRCKQSFEISDWLAREAMHSLASSTVDDGPQDGGEAAHYVLFNPSGHAFDGVMEMDIDAPMLPPLSDPPPADGVRRAPAWKDFVLLDPAGREMPFQVCASRVLLRNQDESGRQVRRAGRALVKRLSISLLADGIPSFGYRRISVRPVAAAKPPRRTDLRLDADGRGAENAWLKVRVNGDGALDVRDKSARAWYRGLHVLEDGGDVGDHYFFHPPKADRRVLTAGQAARISVARQGPVEIQFRIQRTLRLPAGATRDQEARSARRVSCPVTTRVTLRCRSRQIDFQTTVDNRATDHRLRALFPTGLRGRSCDAGSVFDVVRRERAGRLSRGKRERTMGYNPQSLFVDLSDGRRGVAFFTRGLPQYQARPDGTMGLTLFRAVSHLGKYHLPPYRLGDSFLTEACHATPLAQMPGEQVFDYAVCFHPGGWMEGGVAEEAQRFAWPPEAMIARALPGRKAALPPEASFVAFDPPGCVLSAVKCSEDGKALIVRFYNPCPRPQRVCLTFWRPFAGAARVNLAEDRIVARLRLDGPRCRVPVKGHEIVTLRLTKR